MFKRFSFFLVFGIYLLNLSCILVHAEKHSLDYQRIIEDALNVDRLKYIYAHPEFPATKGPPITLPDGDFVVLDTIIEAIQPIIKQGKDICPSLIKELKNQSVHIRFGAYLALKKINNIDFGYYPFFPPSHKDNIEAYEKWENYILGKGTSGASEDRNQTLISD